MAKDKEPWQTGSGFVIRSKDSSIKMGTILKAVMAMLKVS